MTWEFMDGNPNQGEGDGDGCVCFTDICIDVGEKNTLPKTNIVL